MNGRQRPKLQIDQCLSVGLKSLSLSDEMSVFVDLEEEYSSARQTRSSTRRSTGQFHSERPSSACLTRSSTRRSTGQRNSGRHTEQRHAGIERASYKRVPCMSDRRTDRTTGRTATRTSEYREVPDDELYGAPEASVLVAGIASVMDLRKRVEKQNSEGYHPVMDTEYINPRRNARSKQPCGSIPVLPQPPGSSNGFGSAHGSPATEPAATSTSTSTSEALSCLSQEQDPSLSAASVSIHAPAEMPPAKRRPGVAKLLAARSLPPTASCQ